MSDESCSCCGTGGQLSAESETSTDRWIAETPVTEETLPADMREAMGRFLGEQSNDTLGGWVEEFRRRAGGGSVAFEDLCHANAETNHWGILDGEKRYFKCFYDAVALAELADSPVDIHTESPAGTTIEARATGDGELEVTPSDAVVSFGIDREVEAPPEGAPMLPAVYSAICPYVKAFPSRAAYEEWAEVAPAATVGMPLANGMAVAAKLVE